MPPRRACDLCYKRKIQCVIKSRGEPCDWCESHGLACTFDRVIQKDPNKRTTSDVVEELSHRVEELEETLRSALSTIAHNSPVGASPWLERPIIDTLSHISPHHSTPPTAALSQQQQSGYLPIDRVNRPTAPAAPQISRSERAYRLSRCHIGSNWYFKGVGLFSMRGRRWIAEGTGENTFLEDFDIFGDPTGSRACEHPASAAVLSQTAKPLPPESICKYLFRVFLRSKTSIVFPILDRGLFEGTIARAYDEDATDLKHQASAEACLWGMLALVARTDEAQQSGCMPEADDCVNEVRRLLVLVNGVVNLDCLQATLLLWTYQQWKGECREASTILTSACRMVCDLGGHFPLSESSISPQHVPIFDEHTRIHLRGLFWLCYCFDKDNSIRTCSPPLLTSEHCDLSDPGEFSTQKAKFNQSRNTDLAKIKENASRLLCSPRAFRYTESELLAHVRQLDDELEEWRLSIGPRYRPRLSIPSSDYSLSTLAPMTLEDRTRTINLQLDYLFTMINIHTLVRKCGDLEANLPDDLHSVVHSSADLSIEASRSIFRFLPTVVDFWHSDSTWIVAHYAPMAAMPLFLNIIIHPVGNPADSDLQILASIGDITRGIPTDRLRASEIEHIQEISEFVMQLIRLSHSAAWKVKKGARVRDLDIIHVPGGRLGRNT